jgi:hypothetical protein
MTKVAVVKLSGPLKTTKVIVAELLTQCEEMAFVELLVDQTECHG